MANETALTHTARQLAIEAAEHLRHAESLEIRTVTEYETAGQLIPPLGKLRRELMNERLSQTRPIDAQKSAIMEAYREAEAPMIAAENLVKKAMLAWRRREEERAAEERRRAEAEAERERQRLERLADKAEARGDVAKAEQFEQRADAVVATAAVADVPKVDGTAIRKSWHFEVVDAAAIPRNYLVPDEKAIARVVTALKDRTEIPGIRVWCEESIGRTGR